MLKVRVSVALETSAMSTQVPTPGAGAVVAMLQLIEPTRLFPLLLLLTAVSEALIVAPEVTSTVRESPLSVGALSTPAAMTYGPTNGPPAPTGAAPAGVTDAVPVSPRARARFSRPFPVSAAVPAASAFRASRPTMTPLEAAASEARRRAAAAETSAEEADVPVTDVVPPPAARETMSVPGAARNVSAPELLDALRPSFWSVFETPMTPRSPAGKVAVVELSLPVAATTTTSWAQA